MDLYQKTASRLLNAALRRYGPVVFLAVALLARPVAAQLRYDEIQQRSIHNAFQKEEQILDQLIKYRVRNFEFDLHPAFGTCRPAHSSGCPADPDWDIYHAITAERTTVCTLRQALVLLRAFHDAVPAHEVITVHLELKITGIPLPTFRCHSSEKFDQLILDVLGSSNVFKPRDLLATKPGATTLFQAVGLPTTVGAPPGDGWPTVDSLRGKFLVVIHATLEEGKKYMEERPVDKATCFLMPNEGTPAVSLLVQMPNNVFQGQIQPPDHARLIKGYLPYLILRSQQVDKEADFQQYQAGREGRGVNLLLTDEVSHYFDPWARTHNSNLYPFGRAGEVGAAAFTHPSVASRQETGGLFELATYSGDLDGTHDSFSFAATETGPPSDRDVWEAAIATTSNDEVHDWGKGMLMARERLTPDSPYFAVGRAADEYGVFLQYRAPGCNGPCGTAHEERGGLNGFDDENVQFVRLVITGGGAGSRNFQAFASVDGVNFVPFGQTVTLPGTFKWRGLAASSHGSKDKGTDAESFFFQAVKRNDAAVSGSIFNTFGIPAEVYSRFTDFSYNESCRNPADCPPRPHWQWRIANSGVGEFAAWAATPGVRPFVGDFNGDKRMDVALLATRRDALWSTMPVAFANGDGSWRITNSGIGEFAGWATTPGVQPLAGDFNGDGRMDIALSAQGRDAGWSTMPVAFANGDGSWRITNGGIGEFAGWAVTRGARPLTGDFDGDGRTDVALLQQRSDALWSTMPVAFANDDGSWRITNGGTGEFAVWATAIAAQPLTGDFNGDKRMDVALLAMRSDIGWHTMPVAYANGDGSWRIGNSDVGPFAVWATESRVFPFTGDFNGDKRMDVALLRQTPGWHSMPVAFAGEDGSWRITNKNIGEFAAFAATRGTHPFPGDFNGDGTTDVALHRFGTGWTSMPVAFANGDGSWRIIDSGIGEFANWLSANGVHPFTGDFNGDGTTDVGLVLQVPGWTTMPIAFAHR